MVGAADVPRKAALAFAAQSCTTVAANVVEGAHGSARIACDDDAFARDLAEEVVAGLKNGIDAAGAEPAAEIKAFQFGAEEGGIGVVARRQRQSMRSHPLRVRQD